MTLVPPPSWRFNQHCRRFPSHASSSPQCTHALHSGCARHFAQHSAGVRARFEGSEPHPLSTTSPPSSRRATAPHSRGADAPASVEDEDDDATGEGGDPGGGAAGDPGGGGAVAARDSTPAVAEP